MTGTLLAIFPAARAATPRAVQASAAAAPQASQVFMGFKQVGVRGRKK